jgi:hypothetical protein
VRKVSPDVSTRRVPKQKWPALPSRHGMLPGVRATIDFPATALKAQV